MTADTFPDLFWGYATIWIFFGGYLWNLRREQLRLRKEIANLKGPK